MADDEREAAAKPIVVPPSLKAFVQGRVWTRDLVGEAGAGVYRLRDPAGEPDLYLKHGIGPVGDDVTDEMTRMRWLGRHLSVPDILHFETLPGESWLLMTALPGRTAYRLLEADPVGRTAIVDAIVRFLRRLHAIPAANCPFNSDHRLRLGHAQARLAAGLVDIDDFGDPHAGWTAEQVWEEMTALLPFVPDSVVTHGDFSLDNILMERGEVVGCIDLGRVGIADRYQDLAILWDCLGEFDGALQARLFAAYGVEQVDEAKLRFHLALDEFF